MFFDNEPSPFEADEFGDLALSPDVDSPAFLESMSLGLGSQGPQVLDPGFFERHPNTPVDERAEFDFGFEIEPVSFEAPLPPLPQREAPSAPTQDHLVETLGVLSMAVWGTVFSSSTALSQDLSCADAFQRVFEQVMQRMHASSEKQLERFREFTEYATPVPGCNMAAPHILLSASRHSVAFALGRALGVGSPFTDIVTCDEVEKEESLLNRAPFDMHPDDLDSLCVPGERQNAMLARVLTHACNKVKLAGDWDLLALDERVCYNLMQHDFVLPVALTTPLDTEHGRLLGELHQTVARALLAEVLHFSQNTTRLFVQFIKEHLENTKDNFKESNTNNFLSAVKWIFEATGDSPDKRQIAVMIANAHGANMLASCDWSGLLKFADNVDAGAQVLTRYMFCKTCSMLVEAPALRALETYVPYVWSY